MRVAVTGPTDWSECVSAKRSRPCGYFLHSSPVLGWKIRYILLGMCLENGEMRTYRQNMQTKACNTHLFESGLCWALVTLLRLPNAAFRSKILSHLNEI